jgi:protein-tyrosine phosphatase
MTRTLDWSRAEDPRDVVHFAVQALAEGHLVAFPTDAQYVVAFHSMKADAQSKFLQWQSQQESPIRSTIALRTSCEAEDYAPDLSPLARRLANRGWPGPLVLELLAHGDATLMHQLPDRVRELLSLQEFIALRMPAHEALQQVVQLSSGPIILATCADPEGLPPRVSPYEKARAEQLTLVIDDGPTHFRAPPSVVRVEGRSCQLMEEGVLDAESLQSLTQYTILLVCTGNTCRSPMAEKLLQAKLEKRFAPAKPPPVVALSAGTSAMAGGGASHEAMATMAQYGLDLRHHQSCPLTHRMASHADLILTMTSGHRQAILARWPELAGKMFLLSRDGRDVADPFGGSIEVYRQSASQIDRFLDDWIAEVDTTELAKWEPQPSPWSQ